MMFSVSLVPEPILSPTPTPTEVPSVAEQTMPTSTPTPTPEVTPEAGQTVTEEETITVQMVWYPTSVVSVDSVYVGTTDASGILSTKLQKGTHVVELTRILLDGSTQPKKYTVDVNEQTTVLNFLLTS